jgi:hypothetical protein
VKSSFCRFSFYHINDTTFFAECQEKTAKLRNGIEFFDGVWYNGDNKATDHSEEGKGETRDEFYGNCGKPTVLPQL